MKILTDKSFIEAINLCKDNECYRVLIVTQYSEDFNPLLDSLLQICDDVVYSKTHSWAKFQNGSVIDMISSAATTRGRRANLVLCQADVYNEYDEIKYVLGAMEMTNVNFKLKDEV